LSHELDERQRIERVDKARALLVTLNKAKKCAWHFILTGDESWFFYYTERDSVWLPPDIEVHEVARRLINTPKVMVTVFWNPTGIHILHCLPEDRLFNTAYFIDHVLSKIKKLLDVRAAASEKEKFILHMNDSLVHRSKAGMERVEAISLEFAPHPPYSTNLAPSDFFLFGYTKQRIASDEFGSPGELEDRIRNKLSLSPKVIFQNAFVQ
jgi:hypothetical protein